MASRKDIHIPKYFMAVNNYIINIFVLYGLEVRLC